MRETILTDDEGTRYCYENIKTQGWLAGHTSGLDAAVNFLKDRAVELFKAGKDSEATQLRKLADEMQCKLEPNMKARARRHEDEFPAIVLPEE
jgi:hypothetical protein